MLRFLQSAMTLPLATSAMAAQEGVRRFAAGGRGCCSSHPLSARLFALTCEVESQFGDILGAVFQVGNQLQRDWVDLAFDVAGGALFNEKWVGRKAGAALALADSNLRAMAAPQLAWLELQNKYQVYNLVKNVAATHSGDSAEFPLLASVAMAYQQPVYTRLWVVEGIGHLYGQFYVGQPGIRGLLTEGAALQLPAKSMMMMHAGIGLAFGQTALAGINPYGCAAKVDEALDRFADLCAANTRPGYVGGSFESLGLVTRFFYPEAVGVVDTSLRKRHAEIVPYFWHGVGRAHYFYPTYFVPGVLSPWVAVQSIAPDDLALDNLVAGLAWAFTLVNVRQPQIMANFLGTPPEFFPDPMRFSNGLQSSMIMARNVEPDETYIGELCRYRPDTEDAETQSRWKTIPGDCCRSLQSHSQVLRRYDRLGEVFRYQDLQALVDCLEGGGKAC